MSGTTFQRLQNWYLSNCDGEWEHGWGVKIETLDNPGWSVQIDLEGTRLQDVEFRENSYGVGDQAEESSPNWLACKVANNKFNGVGGPMKLEEMLIVFLDWAEQSNRR